MIFVCSITGHGQTNVLALNANAWDKGGLLYTANIVSVNHVGKDSIDQLITTDAWRREISQ